MRTRYVITGTWSGYVPRQRKVVHRSILAPRLAKACTLQTIIFTDNTTLDINVAPVPTYQRVKPLPAYSSLIYDALKTGNPTFTVAR